jgi:hypothetical protein
MATVTAHTAIDNVTTYLDVILGGQSGGHHNAPNTDITTSGTLDSNTAWLSGAGDAYSAGTAGYPGSLTPFTATNSQGTNKPVTNLRMISVRLRGTATTAKFAVNAYDTTLSRVYSVLTFMNETDPDETGGASNCTTIDHHTGEVTMTLGTANDYVYLTLIAG